MSVKRGLTVFTINYQKSNYILTILQYLTMSIHCSFACFSSRFLRDSTGTLLWRCIVLAGLAAGPEEEGEFCLTLFPSLFVLHALHTLVVGGLTRVHDGHGQPEFPVLEPDKLFHIFFIRRITPMVLKVFMLWLVEEYINLQQLENKEKLHSFLQRGKPKTLLPYRRLKHRTKC